MDFNWGIIVEVNCLCISVGIIVVVCCGLCVDDLIGIIGICVFLIVEY